MEYTSYDLMLANDPLVAPYCDKLNRKLEKLTGKPLPRGLTDPELEKILNAYPEAAPEFEELRQAVSAARLRHDPTIPPALKVATQLGSLAEIEAMLEAREKLEMKEELQRLAGKSGRIMRFEQGNPYTKNRVEGAMVCSGLAIHDMAAFCKAQDFQLQKPTASCFHKFLEGIDPVGDFPAERTRTIFLVEHDWAGAFAKAEDFHDGQFQLPDRLCAFEFRITGRKVIMLACADEHGHIDWAEQGAFGDAPFIETPHGWAMARQSVVLDANDKPVPDNVTKGEDVVAGMHALTKLCRDQIRAACISLEAEVTTKEIVRQPYKMNRAREKRGRLPLFDYHVIRLAHRARYEPLPDDMKDPEKRKSPRLHFRRGHWRHHPNHRVWINWMLVGNPDLGYIDKEYRL